MKRFLKRQKTKLEVRCLISFSGRNPIFKTDIGNYYCSNQKNPRSRECVARYQTDWVEEAGTSIHLREKMFIFFLSYSRELPVILSETFVFLSRKICGLY